MQTALTASASLELTSTESGWMIRRGEGPKPPDCAVSKDPEPTARNGEQAERADRADLEITQGIRKVGEHSYEVQCQTCRNQGARRRLRPRMRRRRDPGRNFGHAAVVVENGSG
jgi:hypothetical protein